MQKYGNGGEMHKATRWLDWVVLDKPFRWICSLAYSTKKRGVEIKNMSLSQFASFGSVMARLTMTGGNPAVYRVSVL